MAKSTKLLKVSFPLALQSESCLYEIQSGVLTRPTHRNTTFDDARLEVCAQRFAAIQEGNYGVALINDGKYGHSCRENVLSLSLLRSPRSPDDKCDLGSHFFSYHLLPYFNGITSINKAIEEDHYYQRRYKSLSACKWCTRSPGAWGWNRSLGECARGCFSYKFSPYEARSTHGAHTCSSSPPTSRFTVEACARTLFSAVATFANGLSTSGHSL